jgi:recombination endonuclease VII
MDEKRCAQCGEVKPLDRFYNSKKASDGKDSYCKDCRDGRVVARRVGRRKPPPPPITEKECSKCGVVKPLAAFYRSGRGKGARSSWCKGCKDAHHAEYIARPEVAAKLLEQAHNRAEGKWKRPPRREPIGPGYEVCTSCNEDKPVEEFHLHKLGRNGRDSMCKDCKRAIHQRRRQDQGYREKEHRWTVARRFGLEPGQYDAMLIAQKNGCAICGGVNGNSHHLHVDHDHATGFVRGLLCYTCNTGLGVFKDDPELLRAAIRYLEERKH